jgi:hypothetical protein
MRADGSSARTKHRVRIAAGKPLVFGHLCQRRSP